MVSNEPGYHHVNRGMSRQSLKYVLDIVYNELMTMGTGVKLKPFMEVVHHVAGYHIKLTVSDLNKLGYSLVNDNIVQTGTRNKLQESDR